MPWWGRLESNQLPSGYEPPALTDELRPHAPFILTLLRYNREDHAKKKTQAIYLPSTS